MKCCFITIAAFLLIKFYHQMLLFRDRKGRPIECESSDVHVQIEAPDGTMNDADVTAQNGGKHRVTYTPSLPGQHRIHVTIRSCLMNESPFAVNVPYKTRDYENMNHPELTIGGPGGEPGQLKGARGVTVDINNRIVVCDRNNFRVQVFDSSGEFLFTFGKKGNGNGEFPGGPLSVAVSKDGTFFVSDWIGGLVQAFDSKGEFLTRFNLPGNDDAKCGKCHVVVDHERVYVADCQNRYIYMFSCSGEHLSHFKVGCLDEDDGLQSKLYGIAINSRGKQQQENQLKFYLLFKNLSNALAMCQGHPTDHFGEFLHSFFNEMSPQTFLM